jgi:hypothetical protein
MTKDIDLKDLTVNYLHQLLEHRNRGDARFILKENGTPRAALLSVEDFKLFEQARMDKKQTWDDLLENLKTVHALNPTVSEKKVHTDVAAAIQAIRRERRSASR